MFVPPAMSLFARLPARPHALGWAIRYALLGLGLAACPPLLAAPASSASATSAAAPTREWRRHYRHASLNLKWSY